MANAPIIISDQVVFEQLGDNVVLLDLGSEQYFELNGVGSRIWGLVHEYGDLDQVLQVMTQEYESDEAILRAELVEFVDRLASQGWLRTGQG